MPVPPPDPPGPLRAVPGAAVHVPEGNPARPAAPQPLRWPATPPPPAAAAKTRARREPGVMAFWCQDEYGLPV